MDLRTLHYHLLPLLEALCPRSKTLLCQPLSYLGLPLQIQLRSPQEASPDLHQTELSGQALDFYSLVSKRRLEPWLQLSSVMQELVL
jgi:hypothetical protein